MKQFWRPLVVQMIAALIPLTVGAQTGFRDPVISPGTEIIDYYYHIISDGGSADASVLIRELELRFAVFNRLFRFDAAALDGPLKVRVFGNKADYDQYVYSHLGQVWDGSVYIHYNQADKRELVIHRGSAGEARMLPHQAFVQYLRAFIPNPPAWIREGFAIYFDTLRYDRITGELFYEENMTWSETFNALGSAAPSLESIFLADQLGMPPYFQTIAWSIVSFYMNADDEQYFRTLTEAFLALSPSVSAVTNGEEVYRRIHRWNGETLYRDYYAYIMGRTEKSFSEIIREGQDAYSARNIDRAARRFQEARELRPTHYAPYYYLGLLAYEEQNFDLADRYYRTALQYGADPALVRYALGLNAAAAGRTAEAERFFREAAAASPERYTLRTEDLIRRLR